MKKFVYHYYAHAEQPDPHPMEPGRFNVHDWDGIIESDVRIDNWKEYKDLKKAIADSAGDDNLKPEEISLQSLTFLHEVEK